MMRFSVLARRELYRVAAKYERTSPGLGDRFLDDATRTIAFIKNFPEARQAKPGGVRFWPMSTFPYGLLYAVEPTFTVILAVGHIRRGPKYWLRVQRRSRV